MPYLTLKDLGRLSITLPDKIRFTSTFSIMNWPWSLAKQDASKKQRLLAKSLSHTHSLLLIQNGLKLVKSLRRSAHLLRHRLSQSVGRPKPNPLHKLNRNGSHIDRSRGCPCGLPTKTLFFKDLQSQPRQLLQSPALK